MIVHPSNGDNLRDFPAEVTDSHHHVGNLVIPTGVVRDVDEAAPPALEKAEYRARVATMADQGIDTAVIAPVNRYMRADGIMDTRRVNDAIARYRDYDPQRFVAALGLAEPLHGEAALGEIRRIKAELAVVGVSYHARWQGVATDDPWLLQHVELLGELRMLPVVHAHAESGLESPSRVGHIAKAFPDVPILVTDALSTSSNLMHFLDVASRYGNLYLETSLLYSPAALPQLVSELGANRIVFGSDTYSYRMLTRITPKVINATVSNGDDRALILGGTMRNLLAWTGSDATASTATAAAR